MIKKIKLSYVILILAIAGTLLYSNGLRELPAPAQNSSITLTYWTFDDMYADFMKARVAEWNSRNEPHISLDTSVFSLDEIDYKLWSTLQLGIGAPDIVDMEYSKFGRYMDPRYNYLMPLNSIIDPKKQNIDILSYSRYQNKGFYYAIDYYLNNSVVFYNKDILNEAGVDYKAIKTIEDYLAAGKKIKAKTNKYLLAIDFTDDLVFEQLISLNDSGYVDAQDNLQLNAPANVEVLEMLHSMIYDSQTATLAPTGDFYSYEFYNLADSEVIASIIAPYWYLEYIKRYIPNLYGKLIIAPLPEFSKGAKRTPRISGVATAVTSQCQHPIIAKNLLRDSRLQNHTGVFVAEELSGDPIINDYWKSVSANVNDENNITAESNNLKLLLNIKDSYITTKCSENYNKAVNIISNSVLYQVLRENFISPYQALTEAQETVKTGN
ncbi:MAG TPA: extracellular solute-binding protein [Clostridiaceae bacterium]|nr:extracellular solute-binding protein [Clostridiaceae bacterium]